MAGDKQLKHLRHIERQRRRAEKARNEAQRPFSSMFALTEEDHADSREFEEYLLRRNLTEAHQDRRMTRGELKLALATFNLEELRQLWAMRETKLTTLQDAARLLAHIRYQSGIDAHLMDPSALMNHETIRSLEGLLEEADAPRKDPTPSPLADSSAVSEGKRVEQVLRVIRDGQADFRKRLAAHYGFACMVTGTTVSSVIDAAHIIPYNGKSTNALSNGLLLRKDIHALFDANLLNIGPDLVVYITDTLTDPYYRSLDGRELQLAAPPRISEDALRRRMAGETASEIETDSIQ